MTPAEYSARINDLEWRIDHDLSSAIARAMNAGPGSGAWKALATVCRDIGQLAETLEEEVR